MVTDKSSHAEIIDFLRSQGVTVNLADLLNRSRALQLLNNYNQQVAQRRMAENQLGEADAFRQSLPSRVAAETEAARLGLSRRLTDETRNIAGAANRRGLYRSGMRQQQQGMAANRASADFADQRGNIIKNLTQQSQEMYAAPLASSSQQRLRQLRGQNEIQSMQNRYNQITQDRTNQGMGLVGQGIGYAAGNRERQNG